jgi:AraC family transcriptional regulator
MACEAENAIEIGWRPAFPVEETHAIALESRSRIVLHSAGLGWRRAFASLTMGREWSGRVDPSAHFAIAYCLRGVNRVERQIDGVTEHVHFRQRQFGIMPTHASAHYSVRGGADVLMVYLCGSMVEGLAWDLYGRSGGFPHLEPRMGFVDALLEQLFLSLLAALERQNPHADACYADQLAQMAAAHLLRTYSLAAEVSEPPASPAASMIVAAQRAGRFIDEHLDEDLSLDLLAREVGATPAALTQAFAHVYRKTPHRHVIERRVEQARRLLIGTNLALSEIALQTGFASQSHFSVAFKKSMGQTPGAYRRGV